MKILVTGAAGFIGSHLSEELLRQGHAVVGVDAFIPYYPRPYKESNLAHLRGRPNFRLHEIDLRHARLDDLVADVDVVYHLAAMPGLTRSWVEFDLYESCNVNATHRLLDALSRRAPIKRFVYCSTSSVYGKYACGDEMMPLRPTSPYGVTKLAAENLCRAHAEECGLPLTVLRYFSVYGPRQRPEMGYTKFVDALLRGSPITVNGDGLQVRGNTYIDDCVAANIAVLDSPVGETYNVGGGESANVWDIVGRLENIVGRKAVIRREAARPGDQRVTAADTTKLTRHVGWTPAVTLDEGLSRQVEYQRAALGRMAA